MRAGGRFAAWGMSELVSKGRWWQCSLVTLLLLLLRVRTQGRLALGRLRLCLLRLQIGLLSRRSAGDGPSRSGWWLHRGFLRGGGDASRLCDDRRGDRPRDGA